MATQWTRREKRARAARKGKQVMPVKGKPGKPPPPSAKSKQVTALPTEPAEYVIKNHTGGSGGFSFGSSIPPPLDFTFSGSTPQAPSNALEPLSDIRPSSDGKSAVGLPPAKLPKYVIQSHIKTSVVPTNNNHRHDLLGSSFEIFVGVGASQQRFVVHEEVVIQRSRFIRLARQRRWNKKNTGKMMADERPELFSAYLHCLYFGVESLKKRMTPEDDAISTGDAKFLTDLYILADKLLDPVTANLVIDELVTLLDNDFDDELSSAVTIHVYASTADGSPLRRLWRDHHIHEATFTWPLNAREQGLPYALLQDVLIETFRLESENPKGIVEDVFRNSPADRERNHYHQSIEQE